MGKARRLAIIISFIVFFVNSTNMLPVDAPNTFLTPISLVLIATVWSDSPNNPKQAIKIAIPEKIPTKVPNLMSVRY